MRAPCPPMEWPVMDFFTGSTDRNRQVCSGAITLISKTFRSKLHMLHGHGNAHSLVRQLTPFFKFTAERSTYEDPPSLNGSLN